MSSLEAATAPARPIANPAPPNVSPCRGTKPFTLPGLAQGHAQADLIGALTHHVRHHPVYPAIARHTAKAAQMPNSKVRNRVAANVDPSPRFPGS